jgi:hypothetical protein
MDPYLSEYEDFSYPLMDPASMGASVPVASSPADLEENDNEKRSSNNNGGMWSGPRLGRRKRSVEAESSAERGHESLDTRTLLKILHNFNWAIVPIKGKPSDSTTM